MEKVLLNTNIAMYIRSTRLCTVHYIGTIILHRQHAALDLHVTLINLYLSVFNRYDYTSISV